MLLFVIGLAALILGAELLVRGASRLALSLGITPLVVGLTVVAFGTSAPEMAVSVQSAWSGQVDIALGNVVGSNIFNILSVLGISASVAPSDLIVARVMLAFDLPIMVAVAVVCLPVFFNGAYISRWEGVLFLGPVCRLYPVPHAGCQRPRCPARLKRGDGRFRATAAGGHFGRAGGAASAACPS